MKQPPIHYDFRIDALTPETLRLGRFVEYVDALRAIFSSDDVHFSKVRKGSAVLEFTAPVKAAPKLEARLRLIGGTDMPADMAAPWRTINTLLRRDGASAKLTRKGGEALVYFAGGKAPLAQEAIVHEAGTLDGTVVGVKGVDDSVPVWIKTDEGVVHKCNARRDLARQLAPLWDCYVRLQGKGKWRRGDDGRWTLEEFDILSFERLDDTPLAQVVESIQRLEGNGWNALADPTDAWRQLRAD
ncbi:MAG: hypothetical protein V4709_09425 [Pseudomonadota bacterium]